MKTLARFDAHAPSRPVWLMTLADLGLLLVGFFVFLQASQQIDRKALAKGLRDGFGTSAIRDAATPATIPAMTLDRATVTGFASGSATLPDETLSPTIDWARAAARDPRTVVRVAGSVDGTASDSDPETASPALLAADRARGLASALVAQGAVRPGQIVIAPAVTGTRGVVVTVGFGGI